MDKILRKEGVIDYNFVNDILFFKVKNAEYSHSIELLDYVIDIDKHGIPSGLQIFDASKIFNVPKDCLRAVKNWKLEATIKNNILEVRLVFDAVLRNKIIEKNPILVQRIEENLPDSKVLCAV